MSYNTSSSSDSDDERRRHPKKLFGRKRAIHSVLGGGKVADLVLWKYPKTSAALLVGVTSIWFLFEIADYNLVTLVSHILITKMLFFFIWSKTAKFFNWDRPHIPQVLQNDHALREVAITFHHKLVNHFFPNFLNIACGTDPPLFILVIVSLYILAVIGNYFSFVNLLFLSFVCMETIPYLYDRYENEVDKGGYKMMKHMKKLYKKFDSTVLNKIPRGPVKRKKKHNSY